MRCFVCWFIVGLASLVCSQGSPTDIDPATSPPQMMVVVRKHPTGADLVEITMMNRQYPEELLQAQCRHIGELTGVPVRGLAVYRQMIDPKNKNLAFVKASFATNGLIDLQKGAFWVEPLVRAFAGVPAPNTIYNMIVSFASVSPNESTLKRFQSDKVALSGRYDQGSAAGVEYRVAILRQEPDGIKIPLLAEKVKAEEARGSTEGPSILIWILVVVAALSTGALVYFAVLRPGRRPPSSLAR